jgi:hypothetical protein
MPVRPELPPPAGARNARRRGLVTTVWVLVGAALVVAPTTARASQLIVRDATRVSLQVNANGEALVSYRAGGAVRHVLAWGALNANPPTPSGQQVKFKLDYSGGWGSRRQQVWKGFVNACQPYDGPPLHWLVAACKAPDGSYWALQRWQRSLPDLGAAPRTPIQRSWDLRLSHWSGEPPKLWVSMDWSYRRFDHLFGSFTYAGYGVYGFRSTPTGNPLDDYGRNLYLDSYDSAYGPGWRRENSFLTHARGGTFCYGLYPHGAHPSGHGSRYRATIIGPGVTPDAYWEGPALGAYDPTLDQQAATLQRSLFANDDTCKPL